MTSAISAGLLGDRQTLGTSLLQTNLCDFFFSFNIVGAALVGALQPVSTELGVDVAFSLSENTVLVIQQLFSNLLSAAFILVFKALKDFGRNADEDEMLERPEYTFSFYLLIVIHAAATVFFATSVGIQAHTTFCQTKGS